MPTQPPVSALETRRRGLRVYVRPPRRSDAPAFMSAVAASRRFHRPWVQPPSTSAGYSHYIARFAGPRSRDPAHATHAGFLVCRVSDDAPVGVFNLSEIVRGPFKSAYTGYWAHAAYAGKGYMSEGLGLLLRQAFRHSIFDQDRHRRARSNQRGHR